MTNLFTLILTISLVFITLQGLVELENRWQKRREDKIIHWAMEWNEFIKKGPSP